jgi:hypothetical protein
MAVVTERNMYLNKDKWLCLTENRGLLGTGSTILYVPYSVC